MLLPDVNVLIYAHVEDAIPEHDAYAAWITRLATGPEPFALSVLVLSGFIRVVTNPRVFNPPSTFDQSFAFVTSLMERPTARIVGPGLDRGISWTKQAGVPVVPCGSGVLGAVCGVATGGHRLPAREAGLGTGPPVGIRAGAVVPRGRGHVKGGGLWNGCGVRSRGATGSAGRRCGRGPAWG